jgi:hypothetical protein
MAAEPEQLLRRSASAVEFEADPAGQQRDEQGVQAHALAFGLRGKLGVKSRRHSEADVSTGFAHDLTDGTAFGTFRSTFKSGPGGATNTPGPGTRIGVRMPEQRTEPQVHGVYSLYESVMVGGGYIIRRRDPDRQRTVALVDTYEQWDKFVTAIDLGAAEVAAVHAIDA